MPTSGTRAWVEALRLPMETQWHPWLVDDADGRPQVGGYAVQYERLTFTTVRGAGHMARALGSNS